MIKSKFGPIINTKTGAEKDIVINALSNDSLRDIGIGGGIILMGLDYLVLTTFKNGAMAFEMAEYETLKELDLLDSDKNGHE